MRFWSFLPVWLCASGCMSGVTQVAGTGAIYTTKCSAQMDVDGVEYTARCTPPSCETGYTSGGISHVVVALDPGKKIVGYAEQVCIQDLSEASKLFQPVLEAEADAQKTEDGAAEEQAGE